MSLRRSLTVIASSFGFLGTACGMFAGIDDYRIDDCYDGACRIEGGTNGATDTPDSTSDAGTITTDAKTPCGPGEFPLTITNNTDGPIADDRHPDVRVPAHQTLTFCLAPSEVRLQGFNEIHWSSEPTQACGSSGSEGECRFNISGPTSVTAN